MADNFLPLFDMTLKDARKHAKKLEEEEVTRDYIKNTIFHLITKEGKA